MHDGIDNLYRVVDAVQCRVLSIPNVGLIQGELLVFLKTKQYK